jgi:hypothetical protein
MLSLVLLGFYFFKFVNYFSFLNLVNFQLIQA